MTEWRTSRGRPSGAPARVVRAPWRRWPLATVLLLAWLGGGLVSAALAAVLSGPNDLLYAAVHTALASLALLLLPVAAARPAPARGTGVPVQPVARRPASAAVTHVPAQATTPACHDRPARATA